jgi:hypothetical protein
MKLYHTPESAAQAVRAMFEAEGRIAKTWDDYHLQIAELHKIPPAQRGLSGSWLNSFLAAKLVQEQCNGAGKSEPITFEIASDAVAAVIPELFAEYWEHLPLRAPAPAAAAA